MAGIETVEMASAMHGSTGVIFLLQNASLETAKVGKNYELLNCDDHANFLRRHGKDPAHYRPDICHQVKAAGGGVAVGAWSGQAGACSAGGHVGLLLGALGGLRTPSP